MEKAINAQYAVEELHQEIADIYQDIFDMTRTDYNNQLAVIEHDVNMLEKSMRLSQTRGYLDSAEYYKQLIDIENENISALNAELADLTAAFQNALNSGEIEAGSESFYDMRLSILGVEEALVVRCKIVEHVVLVASAVIGAQRMVQLLEAAAVRRGQAAVDQMAQDALETRVGRDRGARVIRVLRLDAGQIVNRRTEDEDVVGADLLGDLDVGAIHRAERQRAVKHELHAARARRLRARRGNLLRQVGGRYEVLGSRHIVVFQEHDGNAVARALVGGDERRNGVDELDDVLGPTIARRRFAGEDERGCREIG